MFLIICFFLTLWGIYAWRIKKYKQQICILEALLVDRTSEIRESELNCHNMLHNTDNLGICAEKSAKVEQDSRQQKLNFIDIVSHEYRTPLSVINSCLDIIERNFSMEKFPVLHDHIGAIRESSQRLLNIFELSCSEKQTERMVVSLHKEHVDFIDVVKMSIFFIQCVYPEHKILIDTTNLDEVIVLADRELLVTAVTNILDNSCKYSHYEDTVLVNLGVVEEYVVLSIKDNGVGIQEKELKFIFDKFYRSSNVGGKGGAGLGLFLVKKVVGIHNGDLSVSSTFGKGTQFLMHLPMIIKAR